MKLVLVKFLSVSLKNTKIEITVWHIEIRKISVLNALKNEMK